jgi:hypothetical protein
MASSSLTPNPLGGQPPSSRSAAPASPGPVPDRPAPPSRPAAASPPPTPLPDREPAESVDLASEEAAHRATSAEPGRGWTRLGQPPRGRRLAQPPEAPANPLTPEQRLLLLDTWQRSGLPTGDFAPLVGFMDKLRTANVSRDAIS